MTKIYEVAGGNLGAAILATKLALSGRAVRLQLTEENVLVSGWKPWFFGDIRANNGFHAIDVTRAPGLVHLLGVELGLGLALDSRPTGLIINGRLTEQNSYPEGFDSGFPNGVNTIFAPLNQLDSVLAEGARTLFQRVGMRYGDDWGEAMPFMIPWFLPSNVLLDSRDEGDKYRNLLRSGLAIHQRAVPKHGFFGDLDSEWLEKIGEIGIDVQFVPKKKIASGGLSSESYRRFYLSVFETDSTAFDRFAEIIVAWEDVPELARISTFSSEKGKQHVLLESQHIAPDSPEVEKWQGQLQSLDPSASFRVVGTDHTRNIPKPSNRPLQQPFEISARGDRVSIQFASQGPINMAKVYKIALSAFLQIENHR